MTTKEKISRWSRCNSYNEFEDVLLIRRLRENEFSDEQILKILDILDETCLDCFDGNKYCQYCNDE